MARSEKDLVDVKVELTGSLGLDWERIYEDPVFRQITMIHGEVAIDDVNDASPEWRQVVLQEYLLHYIARDRLLRDMPSTNGPGELNMKELEVIDGVSHEAYGDITADTAVS
jgi:hypothetical protein